MLGRVVTVQNRQLYLAPCCASVQEYTGTGTDFWEPDTGWQCQHAVIQSKSRGGSHSCRKSRPKCSAWNCQAMGLPRQHHVLDHHDFRMETYHLCHKHTPPEEWLRRAKNFVQFSQTCRAWEMKIKNSHKK